MNNHLKINVMNRDFCFVRKNAFLLRLLLFSSSFSLQPMFPMLRFLCHVLVFVLGIHD